MIDRKEVRQRERKRLEENDYLRKDTNCMNVVLVQSIRVNE